MIEFPPSYPNLKLLMKAVHWAMKRKFHIPSLTELSPKTDLDALTDLAKQWQSQGLGRLIEVSVEGVRSVHFSLNDKAVEVVKCEDAKTLISRLKTIPISQGVWEVIKLGLAAFFGAYIKTKLGSN